MVKHFSLKCAHVLITQSKKKLEKHSFLHLRGVVFPPAVVGFSSVGPRAVVSCSCLDYVLAGVVVFVSLSPAADAGTLVLTWTLQEDSL